MLSRLNSLLFVALLAGIGTPREALGWATSLETSAPAEDDDCVETAKFATPQEQDRRRPSPVERCRRTFVPADARATQSIPFAPGRFAVVTFDAGRSPLRC